MEMPFWKPQAGMVGRTSMSRLSEHSGNEIDGACVFGKSEKLMFTTPQSLRRQLAGRQTPDWVRRRNKEVQRASVLVGIDAGFRGVAG